MRERTFYHYIMIKRSTHQKDKAIINICKSNDRAPKLMKHKLTRVERRNRKFNNNNLRLQYTTFNNEYKT